MIQECPFLYYQAVFITKTVFKKFAKTFTSLCFTEIMRDYSVSCRNIHYEGEVKNAGECRGYVGFQGFKGFGKEPIRASSLIGVEGFEGSLGF